MRDVFDQDNNRAVVADWLELELAFTTRASITDSLVVKGDQVLEDDPDAGRAVFDDETDEELDREILDERSERRRDDMWNELAHRRDALGDFYPFTLEGRGVHWELRRRGESEDPAVQAAHRVYLAALVMSAFKNLHIKKDAGNEAWVALNAEIPDFMQQIATVAAAGLMGEAYAFGWPRDDSSGFREAIIDLLSRCGVGRILPEFPVDSTGKENDGTVDVVAWRPFGDGLYGGLILYGQVASGANWQDKPIGAYLAEKFLRYLLLKPSETFIEAMFMPFILHNDLPERRGVLTYDAIVEYSRAKAMTFGTIVDRLRLTELWGSGLPDGSRIHNCKEPSEIAEDVDDWVMRVREYCGEAV